MSVKELKALLQPQGEIRRPHRQVGALGGGAQAAEGAVERRRRAGRPHVLRERGDELDELGEAGGDVSVACETEKERAPRKLTAGARGRRRVARPSVASPRSHNRDVHRRRERRQRRSSDDDAEAVEFIALPGGGAAARRRQSPAPRHPTRSSRSRRRLRRRRPRRRMAQPRRTPAPVMLPPHVNDAGGGAPPTPRRSRRRSPPPAAAPVLHTRRAARATFYDDADASASAAEVAAYIAERVWDAAVGGGGGIAAIKDPPRPKRSAAAAAAAGWRRRPSRRPVQCDECAKWRLVRTEAAPGEGQRWVCSRVNADARHNSCAAAQHLHERAAPEDGERVEPMGYKSREQLADDLRPCTAARARTCSTGCLARWASTDGWRGPSPARSRRTVCTTRTRGRVRDGEPALLAARLAPLLRWEQRLHARR